MHEQAVLEELISLSLTLGKPENDYVILGEGNTSAKINDDLFFVKASGKYLSRSDKNTFVKIRLKDAVAMLHSNDLTDDEISQAACAFSSDCTNTLRPSVETLFHAFLLSLPGVNFVGHTHPTALNAILCCGNPEEIVRERICPIEIVYCGVEPVYVEYADSGLALARAIRDKVNAFVEKHGSNPKEIMIQNHGLIALGENIEEVEAITAMACKAARTVVAARAFGEVHYLARESVEQIGASLDDCR